MSVNMQPILPPKIKIKFKKKNTKLSLKPLCGVNAEIYLQGLFNYFNFHVGKLLVVISVLFFNFSPPCPPPHMVLY